MEIYALVSEESIITTMILMCERMSQFWKKAIRK